MYDDDHFLTEAEQQQRFSAAVSRLFENAPINPLTGNKILKLGSATPVSPTPEVDERAAHQLAAANARAEAELAAIEARL